MEDRLLEESDFDAEQGLIGGLLLSPDGLDDPAVSSLRPRDFYYRSFAAAFTAMLGMHQRGDPIDLVTVESELRTSAASGADTVQVLTQAMRACPDASNVGWYAKIVAERGLSRRIRLAGEKIAKAPRSMSGEDLLTHAETLILEVGGETSLKFSSPHAARIVSRIDQTQLSPPGILTGFKRLDKITGGLRPGTLILVASRPSMGKSAFKNSVVDNMTSAAIKAADLSMEDDEDTLYERQVSRIGRVPFEGIRCGGLSADELEHVKEAAEEWEKRPYVMSDAQGLGPGEVLRWIRQAVVRHGAKVVFIDHAQEIEFPRSRWDKRPEQVYEFVRALRKLARTLGVPIVLLYQLNRDCENRTDKRPILRDLADTGGAERVADLIIFLYRDEVYYYDGCVNRSCPHAMSRRYEKCPADCNKRQSNLGMAEAIVAKQRNGRIGVEHLHFSGRLCSFFQGSFEAAESGPTARQRAMPF